MLMALFNRLVQLECDTLNKTNLIKPFIDEFPQILRKENERQNAFNNRQSALIGQLIQMVGDRTMDAELDLDLKGK